MAIGQRAQTLHGLLEKSAARQPDNICVKFGSHPGYTYDELVAAMKKCAAHVATIDARVVGLVADRCYAMVVSMLGVMKAGKAYCPVEPDFPPARVAAMIEGADITHFLVPQDQLPQELLEGLADLVVWGVHDDGRVVAEAGSLEVAAPAKPRAVPAEVPDDATAYVLFTSGSTGQPKGCMVPHRGSCKYAKAVVERCGLTEDMVFLLKTPYVFDVSIQDIYTAFAVGGTLVIADPRVHKDAGAIAEAIVRHKVNVCCFVPTLLVEFANYLTMNNSEAQLVKNTLRHVLTIGEALLTATCKQMFNNIKGLEIHNLYGPTEASVGVSHQKVLEETVGSGVVVPIGKPLDYCEFRSFDPSKYQDQEIDAGKLVDVKPGEVGELFIGGDCLAQGYIKNPEKTRAAFFHFPEVLQRPEFAASPFSLYKTGDLVRKREDGVYEFLGRNDFQVKIGGVRIECEEVSTVLQSHPAISDALVTAFDSPFGKALAAYVVASPDADWTVAASDDEEKGHHPSQASTKSDDSDDSPIDNVSKWGAVYDEMYKQTDASISMGDPTLNWSGYTDTYSRQPHIEPVIKEWVEWSCEQVSRHASMFQANRQAGRHSCVTEIGCGNGMLLFRLAPLVGSAKEGRYLGTDISTTALEYIREMRHRAEYGGLGIETAQLAAHEILKMCKPEENDQVLCNGVTMYFPSANYLLECMQTAVEATRPGGYAIFGDVQSKRHLLPFRASVETYQALRRPDATAAAVLQAVKQSAAREELSYFDDGFFQRLDRAGADLFNGRVGRLELRLKRGWWHSEFNRFRYDVELVLKDQGAEHHASNPKSTNLSRIGYAEMCEAMGLESPAQNELVDSRLTARLPGWIAERLAGMPQDVDGLVVTLPNARTLPAVRLLEWLEEAAKRDAELRDLPTKLHPTDAHNSSPCESARFGLEPEMLFTMALPEGWTQRVIWDEDPAMLRFVLLRNAAAQQPWLGVACAASSEPLSEDLAVFKNRAEDVEQVAPNPMKVANDALKAWTARTSLLAAMRPTVYIPLETFPKNAAGKTDRAALPDAAKVFKEVSDAATMAYEPPSTDEEKNMVAIWEKVLKVPVGVNTPFVAYGGHSLTAIQLCSSIVAEFGHRPDLVFLTSEDCSVRALLGKMKHDQEEQGESEDSRVVCLSPPSRRGTPLIVFCAAGAGVATYQAVAEHMQHMVVYAVELPGRGKRAGEPVEPDFGKLIEKLSPDVMRWSEAHRDFYAWGDSLGAVIAYEFAKLWQESPHVVLLGLYVSGNAGPTVASTERGMGESVTSHLGMECDSCADMTRDDWKHFLLASSGDPAAQSEIKSILADDSMADALIAPLRADCLAYESYHLENAERLIAPIMTMRGENDHITSGDVMQSWEFVTRGRLEHKEFVGAGHMLARDCPVQVARHLGSTSQWDLPHKLPDLSHKDPAFENYRKTQKLALKKAAGYPA